jgi:5-exo-hydroxycamphor dehydrogenase
MRQGRRVVFVEPGRRLQIREVDVPDPGPGAVLVRTVLAGVCGSDAHRLDGDIPGKGYPVSFGHEGVGIIDALGERVSVDAAGTPIAVGDLVYWLPGSTDEEAAASLQTWPPPATEPSPASYQDYATVAPRGIFFRVPEHVRAESVIAFGCALPTALGGMRRLGGIQPGQSVVVQGCGPVGLASTMLAGLSAARQVIVIGAPEHRLAAARRLGATTVIPLDTTTVEERVDTVRRATEGRGADVVLECAGRLPAFGEAMQLLAERGALVVLGLFSGRGTVELDPFRLNNLSQRIIGTLGAFDTNDYLTAVRLAARFDESLDLGGLVTHRFPLADTEHAIVSMRTGEAIKAVVAPGDG